MCIGRLPTLAWTPSGGWVMRLPVTSGLVVGDCASRAGANAAVAAAMLNRSDTLRLLIFDV